MHRTKPKLSPTRTVDMWKLMTVYKYSKQYSTEPSADPGAGGRGGHIHNKHLVSVNIWRTKILFTLAGYIW